jgi:hypothetical protein
MIVMLILIALFNKNIKDQMGVSGYNNSLESMRGIFMAFGPSFKKDVTMRAFSAVNVYSLACSILSLDCHENNGTMAIFEPYLNSANRLFRLDFVSSSSLSAISLSLATIWLTFY